MALGVLVAAQRLGLERFRVMCPNIAGFTIRLLPGPGLP